MRVPKSASAGCALDSWRRKGGDELAPATLENRPHFFRAVLPRISSAIQGIKKYYKFVNSIFLKRGQQSPPYILFAPKKAPRFAVQEGCAFFCDGGADLMGLEFGTKDIFRDF